MEQQSRALVPFAVVNIKELGMKVTTNEIGFFNFQMVPQGTYTVQASVPGYPSIADQATVTRRKTSNLALVVAPTVEMPTTADIQNAVGDYSSHNNARGTGSDQIDNRPGAISLKTNSPDAVVLVDNQQVGTGSGNYRNIKAGSHSLRVSKPGYKDWHKNVSVKPGQTLSESANLEKMTGAETGGLKLSGLDDYLKAAQESYDQNEFSSAVKYYNQAAQMTSTRAEVYLGRGLAYSQLGNNKQASNDFLTAAQTYLQQERYSQAAEAYSYYLQINPQNDNLRYQRGKTYLAAGNYAEAAQDISRFLESNPRSLAGYLDLGTAYYYAGDYQNSVEAFHKARKINSMEKNVYTGLAKAYMGLGDKRSCKQYYDKFKELATYVDKEKLKDDQEWTKVLDYLQIKEE
jgi:tetratricopeptide (TPR) repeat protein